MNSFLQKSSTTLSQSKDHTLPIISIITVHKNNLEGLIKTCKSISTQDWPYFEHILIDGNSEEEGVHSWLESSNNKATKTIIEQDNGIYDAMNKGLKHATGLWILFLNSGDIFKERNSLNQLKDNFKQNYAFIYCDFHINDKLMNQKDIFNFGLFNNVCHQTILYHKRILGDFKFDTSFKVSADCHLLIELSLKYSKKSFIHIKESLIQIEPFKFSKDNAILALKDRERSFKHHMKNPFLYFLNWLNLKRQQLKLKRNKF